MVCVGGVAPKSWGRPKHGLGAIDIGTRSPIENLSDYYCTVKLNRHQDLVVVPSGMLGPVNATRLAILQLQ